MASILKRPNHWQATYVPEAGKKMTKTFVTEAAAHEWLDAAGHLGKVKRVEGAWRARYRDEAGKEHARHFSRKVDAQRWLNEVTASIVTGYYVAPRAGRVTFKAFAEEWRSSQVFRPSTAALVEGAFNKRVYPVIGDKPLDSILPSHVQALVSKLAEMYAPRTVSVTYSYVSSVFKAAVRDRRIQRTPCESIRLPEIVPARVNPLGVETVLQIADAMPAHLRAIVITAAGTGMRQGEIFGLTVDRVDFLRRTITVDRQLNGQAGSQEFGPPKTTSSNRVIPLPAFVGLELSRHLATEGISDGLIFRGGRGAALSRSTFGDIWRRAAPGVDFHELRHFYASLLIRHGESVKTVQARLGHKNAQETMDTYAHLWQDSDVRTREAVDLVLNLADFVRTAGPTEVRHS